MIDAESKKSHHPKHKRLTGAVIVMALLCLVLTACASGFSESRIAQDQRDALTARQELLRKLRTREQIPNDTGNVATTRNQSRLSSGTTPINRQRFSRTGGINSTRQAIPNAEQIRKSLGLPSSSINTTDKRLQTALPLENTTNDKNNQSVSLRLPPLSYSARQQVLSQYQRRTSTDGVAIAVDTPSLLNSNSNSNEPVVGVLLPLSGPYARIAKQMREAMQVAIYQKKKNPVHLVFADTKGSEEGARDAAYSVLNKQAVMIVGPLLSQSIKAVKEIAWPLGVPLVTLGNSSELAQRGSYMMGYTLVPEIEEIIHYAYNQKRRRIAFLSTRSRYGQEALKAVQSAIARINGTINTGSETADAETADADDTDTRTQSTLENNTNLADSKTDIPQVVSLNQIHLFESSPEVGDWRPVLQRISNFDQRRRAYQKRFRDIENTTDPEELLELEELEQRETLGPLPFDTIIVAITEPFLLRSVVGQLAQLELTAPDVLVMGMRPWDTISDLQRDPSFNDSIYATTPGTLRASFEKTFANLFQEKPHPLTAIAFESMAIVTEVFARNGRIFGASLLQALETRSGFAGIESIVRLNSNGQSDRSMEIKQIQLGRKIVIKPAAKRFTSR